MAGRGEQHHELDKDYLGKSKVMNRGKNKETKGNLKSLAQQLQQTLDVSIPGQITTDSQINVPFNSVPITIIKHVKVFSENLWREIIGKTNMPGKCILKLRVLQTLSILLTLLIASLFLSNQFSRSLAGHLIYLTISRSGI